MENKGLFIRRVIYIMFFGLSLVFLSFCGGNVPYMLFFAIVVNSILMLVYILYVFFSIKIYQSVTERQITKNESMKYTLLLNNESVMAYRDIYLNFMEELSEVKGTQVLGHMSLEPGQGIEKNMELVCRYSGTFYVGIDTIEIMDYFKILKIRFPMPQKMKVTVKPRILMPGNLSFITKYEECHDVSQSKRSNDLIDSTVRKYFPGDQKNLIHWKNSAKRQELMVRTMAAEEILKYVIFMDESIEESDSLKEIVQCDKLRELTVAMVHYIMALGFGVEVFLGENYHSEILGQTDFDEFYDKITEYEFESQESIINLLNQIHREYEENVPLVVITANSAIYANMILKEYRKVHLLDVNSFDDIDEFLQVEERHV